MATQHVNLTGPFIVVTMGGAHCGHKHQTWAGAQSCAVGRGTAYGAPTQGRPMPFTDYAEDMRRDTGEDPRNEDDMGVEQGFADVP